jgi:serine/threonine protein kinase
MAINANQFKIDAPNIGEGATATVWKARHIRTPIPVAVKQIPKCPTSSAVQTQLIREITLHRQLDHPSSQSFLT